MTQTERNQRIRSAIRDATAKATVSKQTARATLIGEGIYTSEGKLHVEFGGKRRTPAG